MGTFTYDCIKSGRTRNSTREIETNGIVPGRYTRYLLNYDEGYPVRVAAQFKLHLDVTACFGRVERPERNKDTGNPC